MLRCASALGLLAAVMLDTPGFALTAKEKMETCKIGADHEKLAGAARKAFLTKCMAKEKTTAARKTSAPAK